MSKAKKDWASTIAANRHAYPESAQRCKEAMEAHMVNAGNVKLPDSIKKWKKPEYPYSARQEANAEGVTVRQIRKRRNKRRKEKKVSASNP